MKKSESLGLISSIEWERFMGGFVARSWLKMKGDWSSLGDRGEEVIEGGNGCCQRKEIR